MAAYRETPEGEPLIWATKQAILALEPETGALRWRCDIPKLKRLFRLGDRLFVLTAEGVVCIDLVQGSSLGVVPLEFAPTAGVVDGGGRLFVAGPTGAAALSTSGEVLWSAKHEFAKGFSMKEFFVCTGPGGDERWREETVSISRYDNPGLLFGHQVAQPDLDSH